jgi:catechol 2,3-dioxygenase-like lactoylglutathione lyase family enzyme
VTDRHVVVDHVLFVVEDLPASRRLYTAALAPLGIEELYVEPNCVSYGRHDLDDFTICEGSPVTAAAHVAFDASSPEEVDAFYEAGLAAGATVRGEPGVWIQYSDRYYGAFLNDLHGNNVEAVFHSPVPLGDAPIRRGVP